jgi:hypothetical protein
VVGACDTDDESSTTLPPGAVSVVSDFENGSDGWITDIADYTEPTRHEDFLSQVGIAPPGLEEQGADFFHLSATNRSDDLFMYLSRPLTTEDGVIPGMTYRADFTVTFASAAPTGCVGIGGAPGESVWLKVGAADVRPTPVTEDDATRMNVDKGSQSDGGEAATVAGSIANGIPCEEALESDPLPYALVTLSAASDGTVTATEDGSLWVFVGTDSGFEGRTSLFYDRIAVVLTPE